MSFEPVPSTSVDELLADPLGVSRLPEGAVPAHVVVIIEYVEPGAEVRPAASRLSVMSDTDASPWGVIGMLRFAERMELDDVSDGDDGAE